jgi:hypothetical protein
MACVGSEPLTLSSAESKNETSCTFSRQYTSVACKGTTFPSSIIVVPLHSTLAVIWWLVTMEAHVQFQPSQHRLCGGTVVLGHVLLKVPQFPLAVSFHQCSIVVHSILNDVIY